MPWEKRSNSPPSALFCPLRVSATYEIFPTAGISHHPLQAVTDGHTARKQAGTTQCCGHRGARAEKPGAVVPPVQAQRDWKTQQRGFGFTSKGSFQFQAPEGDLQPCWSQGLSWLLGSGGEQEPQPPLAGSMITSPPVQLAVPHRQPTGTPVHATNRWINAYVLLSSLSLAEREENQEKSKHSEYPPAPKESPPTAGRTGQPLHQHQLLVLTIIGTSLILTLQKQQLPGGESFWTSSPAHTSPPLPHHLGTQHGDTQAQLFLLHTSVAQNS